METMDVDKNSPEVVEDHLGYSNGKEPTARRESTKTENNHKDRSF